MSLGHLYFQISPRQWVYNSKTEKQHNKGKSILSHLIHKLQVLKGTETKSTAFSNLMGS
jgi:hypothetical protein